MHGEQRIHAAILDPELEAELLDEWGEKGLAESLDLALNEMLESSGPLIIVVPSSLRPKIRELAPKRLTALAKEEIGQLATMIEGVKVGREGH